VGIPVVLLAAAALAPPTAAVIAWIVFCLGALAWLVYQWPKLREGRPGGDGRTEGPA